MLEGSSAQIFPLFFSSNSFYDDLVPIVRRSQKEGLWFRRTQGGSTSSTSLSLRSLRAAQAIALSTSPFSKHSGLPPHNALDDDDATCAVILLNGFRNLTQSGSWISLPS